MPMPWPATPLQVERMANKDRQAYEAAKAARAEQHYSQFSFKPALNDRSLRIARRQSRTLEDLYANEQGAALGGLLLLSGHLVIEG